MVEKLKVSCTMKSKQENTKKAICSVNLIVSTSVQKGQRNMTHVKCTKLKPNDKYLDEDDRE